MELKNTLTILLVVFFGGHLCYAVLPDNLSIEVGDINGDGDADRLILEKRSLRADIYRVFTWDPVTGYTQVSVPEVRTYRGYVDSDPDMRVNAVIEPGNILQANLSDGRDLNHRIENMIVIVSGPSGTANPGSGNIPVERTVSRTSPTENGFIIPKYTMRKLHVGMDIANDYYSALGSVDAAVARAESRINDSDYFYARDMGIAWEVQECVIRVGGAPGSWKTWWTSQTSTYINTKIKFKAPGGGGSSGHVFDAYDVDHQHTCTVGSLSAYSRSLGHEVGHGFAVGHYSSWGDTMSGSNSALGTGTVQRMIDHSNIALEAACPAIVYGSELHSHVMEDCANTQQDQSVEIDLLENDYDGNGETVLLSYVDSIGQNGGTIQSLADGIVRYTPPSGYLGVDRFTYHIDDSTGLTNRHGLVKVYVRNDDVASHIVLDETAGTTAHDIGPYQGHGTLEGGISFDTGSQAGVKGNALANTIIDTTAKASFDTGDPLDGSLSVSLWVKYDQVPTSDRILISKGGAVISGRQNDPRGGWSIGNTGGSGFRFIGNMQRDLYLPTNSEYFDRKYSDGIETNKWYHLVMVLDRANNRIDGWVNNQKLTSSTNGYFIPDGIIESYWPMTLFNCSKDDVSNAAAIDDVRVYNKVLSAGEVALLYAANDDIPAGAPYPRDHAKDALAGVTLAWMPGDSDETYDYDVYFGDNYDAVSNADTSSDEYKGSVTVPAYSVVTSANQQYYWRVDEVKPDSTKIPSKVWRFFTGGKPLFDPILTNPSFEDQVVKPNANAGGIRDWYDSSYTYTTWAGHNTVTLPQTPYGENWAELGNFKWIYQQIGFWTPNQQLEVHFLLGAKAGSSFRGAEVSLWAGGNSGAASDDASLTSIGAVKIATTGLKKPSLAPTGIKEYRLTLSTGTGYATGEPLWVEVTQGGGNGRTLVDNIQIAQRLDGKRGYQGFVVIARYWQNTNCGLCGGADLTGDGNVDLSDLAAFAITWLGDND